jgi:hypothetical protein
VKAPRLIGLLLDLPSLTALAALWRAEPTPRALYRVMTSPRRLHTMVDGLPAAAGQLLRALAAEPLRADDLIARVAVGQESAELALAELGQIGLVVRLDSAGRGMPLAGSVGRERLAVPREVAVALSAVAAR